MSNLKERDSPVGSIEQIFFCDRGERFGKLMVRHLDNCVSLKRQSLCLADFNIHLTKDRNQCPSPDETQRSGPSRKALPIVNGSYQMWLLGELSRWTLSNGPSPMSAMS